MADDYSSIDKQSTPSEKPSLGRSLGREAGIFTGGVAKAVPFYGEKIAEKLGTPKPRTLGERTLERSGTNLPYYLPSIIGAPELGGPAYLGSITAGQTAQEMGAGPLTQGAAEILGGGLPGVVRGTVGRITGFAIPELSTMAKEVKKAGYEIGPGANTRKGMAYGSADDPEALERNLTKATEEATSRAGDKSAKIDANWVKNTQEKLGNEVKSIFQGRTFTTDKADVNEIRDVMSQVHQAFGDQYNSVERIITDNIMGARPGGAIVNRVGPFTFGSTFSADGLRKAIEQVNYRLGTGENQVQNQLLYKLKESLEGIADKNLKAVDPKLADDYTKWKRQYNAFATLRDTFEKGGVVEGGKVNVERLKNIVINRFGTAANAVNNPLYKGLAEWGDVLRTPLAGGRGFMAAAREMVSQSPLGKLVTTVAQPKVESRKSKLLRALGVYGPAVAAPTQVKPSGQSATSTGDDYSQLSKP
jgi:hypothetical protein